MEKKSAQETVKNEKVKPEKELCDGVSQLRDEESIGTIGDDMEDVQDVAIREVLANDQVEDVRENSPVVEPNDQDVREVKKPDSDKEDVASVVVPVVEVAAENSEVEISPDATGSPDPSMMKPSPPSDPSAAKGQGLSPDSRVVNDVSVSPVLKTDRGKEDDIASAAVPVDEVSIENREVETSPALSKSADPLVVEPSLPSDPSTAKGQGLSLLEQKSDSRVVNNVSVFPVLKTDSGKEDVVSAVDEVAVENREVEATPALSKLSDPSVVEPSLPSVPSAAKGQGLSLLQRSYDSRVVRNLSVSPGLRTPPRDGYNWRKYGQKQVKSPMGSRSYYRCTYSECCAKKIECSNESGNMVEIVTKGLHSHEPPRKSSFSPREIRAASAVTPVSEDDTAVATTVPSDSAPSASTKENICQSPTIVERKRNCENEAVEEPEPKRRLNKENTQSSVSVSVSKPGKKHKHVVHAANDVGISGDGYRWRKYGQKMVKGNPNPRNYYRCTSAGCPVRKHIETSVENTKAVVITYKGEHNHSSPVPKKRHETPSSVLLTPTSVRTIRLEDQVNTPSSSQC
ncbi:WRKY transcription factor 32 [Hirschfeldia incana]|nr:WRKY transcription factor 32 [Hirschfeldia incana]